MIQAPDLPTWAALVVALFMLSGAAMTLIGSLGLIRLKSFYERVHSPTLGATVGVGSMAVASIVCFTADEGYLVLQDILILMFVTLTTPVTLMLLARAAIYRDRVEGEQKTPQDDRGL